MVERVLREATAKTKDGRIDHTDFLNHAASTSRYSLFTPMEASIIFHFAGRGAAGQRLAFIDFAQLLDPRWRAPGDSEDATIDKPVGVAASVLSNIGHSAYNFMQGGEYIQTCKDITLRSDERCCGCIWSNYRIPNRSWCVITYSILS